MAHTSTIGAAGSALALPGRAPDRHFKWWIIAPAIFLLLLIGLFPLVYSLGVSFQHRTMLEDDKSFAGLLNYAQLFGDARLWQSLMHTAVITVIALPAELVLGMLMAQLFLERLPGRQVWEQRWRSLNVILWVAIASMLAVSPPRGSSGQAVPPVT